MTATWEGEARPVATEQDLDAIIATVRSLASPTMLFLEDEGGSSLVLGLGAPESVLTFTDPDGRTFHSVGDTRREGFLKFRCREQLDVFDIGTAVPEPQAIDAAREFLATGARPEQVAWEADW